MLRVQLKTFKEITRKLYKKTVALPTHYNQDSLKEASISSISVSPLIKGFIMITHEKKLEQGFDVIGLGLRTTNKKTIEHGTISHLWQRFFNESVATTIDNKIDAAIIVLYYDFEHGKDGSYTVVIGCRVSSLDTIPAGMTSHHVPAQTRTIFTSTQGAISHIAFDLWKNIWALEDAGSLYRTYQTDYEVYDERSHDSENAVMEIHIGVN